MKKGRLGKAFHTYLEYLETIEAVAGATPEQAAKMKLPMMPTDVAYFGMPDDPMSNERIILSQWEVDAYLAGVVRSSAKYKIDFMTLYDIKEKYHEEMEFLSQNVALRLPFEWTTLIVTHETEEFIITAQEQKAPEGGYPEMQLDEGDTFVCLNFAGYIKSGVKDTNDKRHAENLSHFPLELHLPFNRTSERTHAIPAPIDGVEILPDGRKICETLMSVFCAFLYSFELTSLLRHKTPGVRPSKHITRRHKKRKKANHPLFEHTVVKMEIDAPEPGQAGYSMLQAKKRLHAVRGFWRHYRETGKRVWVKAHWRGDEKLGVIRRDVELVTHED